MTGLQPVPPKTPQTLELDDADDFDGGKEVTALGNIQQELDGERDARKEERFIWLCAVLLLFDIFAFKDMQTWSGPVIIGLIQLVFIVAIGRKWGMDHIWTLTERLVDKWDGKFK